MRGDLGVAFAAGAGVMALELSASRWLAPGFGFTLETWAVLIAVTLLAGSLGAWGGGRAARPDGRARVGAALAVAGAWIVGAGQVASGVVAALEPWSASVGAGACALALIAVPVALLGAVVPMLAGLDGPTGASARRVGGLVGASTLGSLVGTLAWAFVVVPRLGLAAGSALQGALLCATAAPLLARPGRAGAVLGVVACVALAATPPPTTPDERDTPYGRIRLEASASGLVLTVNGIAQGTHTPWPIERGDLLRRRQYVELLAYLRPERHRAVQVGLGTGQVARMLRAHGVFVLTIELDPALAALVTDELGFDGPVRVGDGRRELRRTDTPWDFIVLDAFAGESPPAHLVTVEALAEARARLAPGGVVCLHLIARPAHAAVGAVGAALARVFAHRLCVRAGVGDRLQDVFLFGSDAPLRVPHHHPQLAEAGWLGNEVFTPASLVPAPTDDANAFDLVYRPLASELRAASLAYASAR